MTNQQNNELPKKKENQEVASEGQLDHNIKPLPKDFDNTLKILNETILTFSSEVNFASHAFTGNVDNAQNLMESCGKSLNENANSLQDVLEKYESYSSDLQKQISTIALLPKKTQEALQKLVPEIAKEIENIHDQRMVSIESTLKGLQQGLHQETENQLNIAKDLSEQLQKQSNEDLLKKQEMLEKAFNNRMEQMNKVQLQQVASQEKMFQKFVDHTKQEIDSVTSNHGSKFLRNTSICLILSVIAGGISGWYINKQFPRFVSFSKTGDVTIKHSHVKVWEANSVKNPNLNKK